MSNLMLFTNNPSSLLASGINNVATTLALTPGTGSLFPTPGASQIAVVTLEDTLGNIEICWCTGRSGDNLTVTRAQEGTTALSFSSGSRVESRVTAGVLGAFLQKNGGDTLAGTTNLSGVIAMGGAGSLQGGEFTGFVRKAAGDTSGQIYVDNTGVPKSGTSTILTNTNLVANLPSGFGLVSTGMVLMWYGSSGSVPTGYHLCDGTGGTPDLRDKFIVGAGGTYAPTFGNTGGSGSVNLAGGTATGATDAHVLTSAEMPSHRHRLWGDNQTTTTATTGLAASDSRSVSGRSAAFAGAFTDTSGFGANQLVENTGGGGGHSHTLTGVTLGGTVAYVPPFTGLFFIMKT